MSQAQQKQAEDKAYTKAGGLGHRLGVFAPSRQFDSGGPTTYALCGKCARSAFYRNDDPQTTLSGSALSEVCTGRKPGIRAL